MLSRHLGPLAVLAAIVTTAAGCSSPGRGPASDIRPLGGVTRWQHADQARLHAAVEAEIADCMQARGLRYAPVAANPSRRDAETNPYGLLNDRTARVDGYGIAGEFLDADGAPPPAPGSGNRGWAAALTGTEGARRTVPLPDGTSLTHATDGCQHTATEQVYGPGWEVVRARVEALAGMVIADVDRDAGTQEAVRRWSDCMAEAGQPAGGLQAPREEVAERLRAPGVTRDAAIEIGRVELATAVADATCQQDAGLAEAIATAQDRVERRVVLPALRAEVDRYAAMKAAALARIADPGHRPGA